MYFILFQSKLSTIGESRMEMDYRLVENEGLFQEYLEMGNVTKKFWRKNVLKKLFSFHILSTSLIIK